uniref:Uncharacterized protein n=1 Tax=Anopheles albimanus TaxID=7167 RepID=A0A182FZE6_ANOAL
MHFHDRSRQPSSVCSSSQVACAAERRSLVNYGFKCKCEPLVKLA